jgi:hypothetical protein
MERLRNKRDRLLEINGRQFRPLLPGGPLIGEGTGIEFRVGKGSDGVVRTYFSACLISKLTWKNVPKFVIKIKYKKNVITTNGSG